MITYATKDSRYLVQIYHMMHDRLGDTFGKTALALSEKRLGAHARLSSPSVDSHALGFCLLQTSTERVSAATQTSSPRWSANAWP
jgi:hypothetical protein